MAEEMLRAVANPHNQAILGALAVEPTYARRLAERLGVAETGVTRRLRRMEALGLVEGAWHHVDGKNVKLYRLMLEEVRVRVAGDGVRVDVVDRDGGERPGAKVAAPEVRLPEVEGFVGRERELEALGGDVAVVLVEGMAGIGKTSLLAAHARRMAGARRVFWHTFTGVESLRWLANRLAVFLAEHGDARLRDGLGAGVETAEVHHLLLGAVDSPDLLVVLDDLHRAEDGQVEAFVRDAIVRVRRGRLAVASRRRPPYNPAADHVRLLTLEGLSDDGVLAFCERKGVDMDGALLPRLRDEVGGHPLALNLFLEAVASRGVAAEALLDRIPERRLEEYLLEEVHAALDADERRVLSHASLFRGPFRAADLAAVSSKSPEGGLLKLRRRLLVLPHQGGFTLHEVVRNFFYSLLHAPSELHERVAHHLHAKATLEARLEAMHHFLASGRRSRVLAMLRSNLDLRDFDSIDTGYHNLYLEALEAFSEDEVSDGGLWALIQDEKGDIRFHRGEYAEALRLYDAAARRVDGAGDGDAELAADLAWKRALALRRLDRADEAAVVVAEAVGVAPEAGTARKRLARLQAELDAD